MTEAQIVRESLTRYLQSHNAPGAKIKKFLDWYFKHIHIWKAFERLALEDIEKGEWTNAKGICEKLRKVKALRGSKPYKIPNEYTAYFARLFIAKYPQHKSKFELKPLRAHL